MADKFEEFLKAYFNAIRNEDAAFIKKVYSEWLETSGAVPKGQEDGFLKAAFESLKPMLSGKLERTEQYDGFHLAHFKDAEGEFSLTFRERDDSFVFFNERSNYSLFKKVYAIGYNVSGGKLRMLFNGKRSPAVTDIDSTSGFVSMINSALQVGKNEIELMSPDGAELVVSLRISSAKEGDIMNSNQGDALSWDGKVKDPVKLDFTAE